MIWNNLLFVAFPYICLTTFVVGHAYRYVTDPYRWNSRSSEFLEKERLKVASVLFHYGVVLTFIGHFAGLLIPQSVFDAFGINGAAHTRIAILFGMPFGLAALVGAGLLLRRRIKQERIFIQSSRNDLVTLGLLAFVIGIGTFNVFFGHYYVLDSIAPWIRGIVTFSLNPALIAPAPFAYKLHILAALALLGFSPFSRLIHIWSAPLPYLLRSYILFRQRPAD